jgi:hypothetical protein
MHRAKRDTVGDLLNPVRGVRDAMARKGIRPPDHMAENRKRLKEIELERKKEKDDMMSTEEQKRNAFHISRFSRVKSIVSSYVSSPAPASEETAHHDFLKAGSKAKMPEPTSGPREETSHHTHFKPKLDMSNPHEGKPVKPTDRDFVKENVHQTREMRHLATSSMEDSKLTDGTLKTHKAGAVPKYLTKRKKEIEEEMEKDRIEREGPDLPPGVTLLSEEERLETLEGLFKSQDEATSQLNRLPIMCETPSLLKKKETLEKQLEEMDNAISIFSRSHVYIVDDQ